MPLQDFGRLIFARWLTILVTTALALIATIAFNMMTTPLFVATTRLFVSTSVGASANELYQGNRLSQERVLSYTELLMGKTLAQRTIDKLGLDTTAGELKSRVTATSKAETVLIDVQVFDESPVRARDIADALSDEFVVMVRDLETPRPGAPPSARVVVEQRASIPEAPVIPNTKRNIAVGLVLGLSLGVALAILRDQLASTIKDREVLESITGVGVVGNIPLDKGRRDAPAISFETDHSAIAEAFRKLRTNLQFLAVDNPPRVIVITSSVPNEGKSTTAINLALALAEADHKVVLVDGDMRRPSIHKYLNLVGSVGFSTVLSGGVPLVDALQETQFPNLTVLAAGPLPPNPSELVGSKAAKNTFRELTSIFDYVIVDSSPLLAVTDGTILSANVDGTFLIARFGQTKREQLAHAVGHLKDVGAVILGAVSTMQPPVRGDYNSYRYHYYGYDDNPSGQG